MTIFAVMCAGVFPLIHMGRPWLAFWVFPYPNTRGPISVNFRSPLLWDVFAISTYFTVSLLFWYVGLVPDFATLRDRAKQKLRRWIYGFLALGWRGSNRHWSNYERAYLILAAPLVISVHSIVGMDFAAAVVPGWHSAIFPPYFVAGAIFSGFAMVVTLAVPLRAVYGLQNLITLRHLENCAKLILVTGLIVAYGYYSETFFAWYSGSDAEMGMMRDRMFGPYAPGYWTLIACNVVAPQFLWFRRVRRSPALLFVLSLVIQVGMWMERFVIVIHSHHHGHMPSEWGMYYPTVWDWATLLGTMGLFLFLFLLFVRFVPAIAMSEVRELVRHKGAPESH
jgi:molybdopterin-containing oxidoreductase family membrane subunit